MRSLRRIIGTTLSSLFPRSVLHPIFVYLVVAPRVRRSPEFQGQAERIKVMFPGEKVTSRVIWSRDWGSTASLALTRVLDVKSDLVAGSHPEVEACLRGEMGAAEYVRELVENEGWDPQAARERVHKTLLLLSGNSDDFVSEAVIVEHEGNLGIILHDGNHRAAIRVAQGHPTVRLRVTISLHLS